MAWVAKKKGIATKGGRPMNKIKGSVIAFFGLLFVFGVTAASRPRAGFGQDSSRDGSTKLNCIDPPCDAVARGRVAFNDRNLNQLGGNGRA
jgi:hypothetical protein